MTCEILYLKIHIYTGLTIFFRNLKLVVSKYGFFAFAYSPTLHRLLHPAPFTNMKTQKIKKIKRITPFKFLFYSTFSLIILVLTSLVPRSSVTFFRESPPGHSQPSTPYPLFSPLAFSSASPPQTCGLFCCCVSQAFDALPG